MNITSHASACCRKLHFTLKDMIGTGWSSAVGASWSSCSANVRNVQIPIAILREETDYLLDNINYHSSRRFT